MMPTIKRESFSKEVRWFFECPACNDFSDEFGDPENIECVTCEHCGEEIDIED